jgi:hypothetical protein
LLLGNLLFLFVSLLIIGSERILGLIFFFFLSSEFILLFPSFRSTLSWSREVLKDVLKLCDMLNNKMFCLPKSYPARSNY